MSVAEMQKQTVSSESTQKRAEEITKTGKSSLPKDLESSPKEPSFIEECVHLGLMSIFIGLLGQGQQIKAFLQGEEVYFLHLPGLMLALFGLVLVLPFSYGRTILGRGAWHSAKGIAVLVCAFYRRIRHG